MSIPKYNYVDGAFVYDGETSTFSESQKMLMGLSQNVATLQSMIMTQNQQIAQLMTKEAK